MEKKNEKQSKKRFGIIALAFLMFLAVGITAGTTLARYLTEGSVQSNQATIARWGVTLTVTDNNFFGKYYNKGEIKTTNDGVDVASTEENVIAPGTKGSLNIAVTGTPQVKYSLTFTLGDMEMVFLKTGDNTYYYPITWTFQSGSSDPETINIEGAESMDHTAYVTALKGEFAKKLANLENQTPGTAVSVNYTISWEWNFDNSANNAHDTTLGNYAAGSASGTVGQDYRTQMKFNLSVKMEQVQNQNA